MWVPTALVQWPTYSKRWLQGGMLRAQIEVVSSRMSLLLGSRWYNCMLFSGLRCECSFSPPPLLWNVAVHHGRRAPGTACGWEHTLMTAAVQVWRWCAGCAPALRIAGGGLRSCAVLLLLGCLLSLLSEQRSKLSVCKMHSWTGNTRLTQLGNARIQREELMLQLKITSAFYRFILWFYFISLSLMLA